MGWGSTTGNIWLRFADAVKVCLNPGVRGAEDAPGKEHFIRLTYTDPTAGSTSKLMQGIFINAQTFQYSVVPAREALSRKSRCANESSVPHAHDPAAAIHDEPTRRGKHGDELFHQVL